MNIVQWQTVVAASIVKLNFSPKGHKSNSSLKISLGATKKEVLLSATSQYIL